MSWSLFFLGTSSACPTKYRNVSSYGVRFDDGKVILVDCGEGTQHQFAKYNDNPLNNAVPLKFANIHTILITHLHGDHLYGLPGLLASMSMAGRDTPLSVRGPIGLKEYIDTTFRLSGLHTMYEINIVELNPNTQTFFTTNSMNICSYPLQHKIPSVGYLLAEPDKPGKFNTEKANKLGVVDKRHYGMLSQGKSVLLEDGRTINSCDVTDGTRLGRKLLLLGDTCDSSSAIAESVGADFVVHEATFEASMEQMAIAKGHSTSKMAGKFAKSICAKNLILTHFSARYSTNEDPVQKLVSEAAIECPETKVFAANDLEHYMIPKN